MSAKRADDGALERRLAEVYRAIDEHPAVAREQAIQAAGEALLLHHEFCDRQGEPLAYELQPDGSTAYACPRCSATTTRRVGPDDAPELALPRERPGPAPMLTREDVERARQTLMEDERPSGERAIARSLGVSRDAVRYALGKDRR